MREYWSSLRHCQPAGRERVYEWLAGLTARLIPPCCVLCLDAGQPPALDLCAACEADLPVAPPVLRPPPPFNGLVAAFRYEFPIVELLRDLKFRGDVSRGRILGTLLGRAVRVTGTGALAVLPVPLHPGRERQRGYNQAMEIARYAARAVGLPVLDDLAWRRRATAEQARLPRRRRRRNLRGAFEAAAGQVPPVVAIVDDVLTTGATAGELARALHRAGARRVELWVVARA